MKNDFRRESWKMLLLEQGFEQPCIAGKAAKCHGCCRGNLWSWASATVSSWRSQLYLCPEP